MNKICLRFYLEDNALSDYKEVNLFHFSMKYSFSVAVKLSDHLIVYDKSKVFIFNRYEK